MKKIWHYLVQHVRQDFHLWQYLAVTVFVTVCIVANYRWDIEDDFLEKQKGLTKVGYYLLFYGLAYYLTLYTYSLFRKQTSFWRMRSFWIKSLLGLAVLSLDSSVPFLRAWIRETFPVDLNYWIYKVSVNLISVFTVLLPLMIFYFWKEKKEKHLFGLNARQFDVRPYFIMLLVMLPLIAAASFHPNFQAQYPMYKSSAAHRFLQIPEWVTVAGYEVAYGFDFVTVEFLFRGFLVIGMASCLGRQSILAMAVAYCFLHFGKPAAEAISSIFGGYILGVIAYETRSIWGGVIVHLGIAWAMELTAFLQKCVRSF